MAFTQKDKIGLYVKWLFIIEIKKHEKKIKNYALLPAQHTHAQLFCQKYPCGS